MDFGRWCCEAECMELLHKRHRSWPEWARTYVNVFRTVIVAICIAAAIYGWWAHIAWLLAAGTTIGLGELLECTYYLAILDWGQRTRRISS
jgi:hypothetical protein